MFDTMRHIRPDVSTACIGMAASMGAFLLASGAPGKRYSLPNSRIMIHQPLGGAQGQATDIEIQARGPPPLGAGLGWAGWGQCLGGSSCAVQGRGMPRACIRVAERLSARAPPEPSSSPLNPRPPTNARRPTRSCTTS